MEKRDLFFEDVTVGEALPPLTKESVNSRQLVMWAGACYDFYEIHYDRGYALEAGLPGVIVHGPLLISFLSQFVTDWLGERGTLRSLRASNRAMTMVGERVEARGKVTGKEVQGGQHLVHLDVWLENEKGGVTTPGTATVILRSKGSAN